MSVNLDDLVISQENLESLVDINIFTQIGIDIYQGIILKNKNKLLSLLLTEIFTFIVVIILVIPLILILLRSWGNIPQGSTAINQLLLLLLGVCLGIMFLINIYLWQQTKKTKSLAILVDKTEQYNKIIESLKLIERLESVNPSNNSDKWENNHRELIEALKVSKNSLIQAFTVEKIIRKHQVMLNNQHELLNDLESNLSALMTFDANAANSHYRELLQNTIQIGITVHKEVKKLQNERFF